jgi:hypothetical protein
MRDLPHIEAVYLEIDAEFETRRATANSAGDAAAVQRIEAKQKINDQAYFVLCWGQLESEIDDTHAVGQFAPNRAAAMGN